MNATPCDEGVVETVVTLVKLFQVRTLSSTKQCAAFTYVCCHTKSAYEDNLICEHEIFVIFCLSRWLPSPTLVHAHKNICLREENPPNTSPKVSFIMMASTPNIKIM